MIDSFVLVSKFYDDSFVLVSKFYFIILFAGGKFSKEKIQLLCLIL